MDLQAVKAQMRDQVAAHHDVLVRTSHQIHEHPELTYEERFAHDLLSDVLDSAGIALQLHAYGLAPAFFSRSRSTGPTITFLCDYVTLPRIRPPFAHHLIPPALSRPRPPPRPL